MQTTLVLASTSPRRIDLMKQVGFTVLVRSPDADETPLKDESPRALVMRLAREKAFSIGRLGFQGGKAARQLVISADTTVVAPGGKKILNKPGNEAEARRMLAQLSGRTHTVLTGYCILPVDRNGKMGRSVTRVVSSRVKMRKLSAKEIQQYVKTGEPMDKAGAYAVQGRGMVLIDSVQGSYTNVVGLPMCQLVADLEKVFGLKLFSGN